MEDKAISRSVSLSETLWVAIDAVSVGHGGRSEFIRTLVVEELQRQGHLDDMGNLKMEENNRKLALIYEAEAAGVDVEQLLTLEMRKAIA